MGDVTGAWPGPRRTSTKPNALPAKISNGDTSRKGEYVRGDASTNAVESYFALLKRGIIGSFHHVSTKHLDRYCDEFSLRWNHRKSTDAERTTRGIELSEGCRLMYR